METKFEEDCWSRYYYNLYIQCNCQVANKVSGEPLAINYFRIVFMRKNPYTVDAMSYLHVVAVQCSRWWAILNLNRKNLKRPMDHSKLVNLLFIFFFSSKIKITYSSKLEISSFPCDVVNSYCYCWICRKKN